MTLKKILPVSTLAVLLLVSGSSFAEEAYYDRVSFAVSAEKEVENDVLTAVLFASQTGQDIFYK